MKQERSLILYPGPILVHIYREYARGVALHMRLIVCNYEWKSAWLWQVHCSVFLYCCRVSVFCGLVFVYKQPIDTDECSYEI